MHHTVEKNYARTENDLTYEEIFEAATFDPYRTRANLLKCRYNITTQTQQHNAIRGEG